MAIVPDWFDTEYLGQKVDNNGNVVESSDDENGYFALLFEFAGDVKAIRHCLYCCKATTRPALSGETKGESTEPATSELSLKATPMPVGDPIIKSRTTADSSNYDTWYTAAPSLPEFTS